MNSKLIKIITVTYYHFSFLFWTFFPEITPGYTKSPKTFHRPDGIPVTQPTA